MKYLFEAVTKVHGVSLSLVGDGPDLDKYKSKYYFKHYRAVDHKTLARLLNEHDAFVFPSFWEGFPNAVLEAMSCGLPVIATSVGGIPEMITHDYTGLLVTVKDAKSIAASLSRLKNPEFREFLGENARAFVKDNFEKKDIMDDLYNWLFRN